MLRFVTFRKDRGALTAMIRQGEDLEAHVLHERGWTISAIARHLGRDRKTVRAYLSGERKPGERKPVGLDAFAPYASYRMQPGSTLSCWFVERTAGAKGRIRKIMAVALARKLLVALWRYVETGEVPAGARFAAA